MAGRKIDNPLRSLKAWHRETVLDVVLPRLETMDLTEALKAGFTDEEGRKWGLPPVSTFYEWLAEDPQLSEACARARKLRASHLVNEALDIVDADPPKLANGAIDGGAVRHAESRAKQRQWMASKLDRATYGEQVQVDMQLHGAIDIVSVLAEARGRVINGHSQTIESPSAIGDASDLFE